VWSTALTGLGVPTVMRSLDRLGDERVRTRRLSRPANGGADPSRCAPPSGGRNFQVRPGGQRPPRHTTASLQTSWANPMLWFHPALPVGPSPTRPDVRPRGRDRGVRVRLQTPSNEDLARAPSWRSSRAPRSRWVMVHDYHPVHATRTPSCAGARPTPSCTTSCHIPWTQSDAWRVLTDALHPPRRSSPAVLANDIVGFPHAFPTGQKLPAVCCRDLIGPRGRVRQAASCATGDREVWVAGLPAADRPQGPRRRIAQRRARRGRHSSRRAAANGAATS